VRLRSPRTQPRQARPDDRGHGVVRQKRADRSDPNQADGQALDRAQFTTRFSREVISRLPIPLRGDQGAAQARRIEAVRARS
jgi:hypothetical protein